MGARHRERNHSKFGGTALWSASGTTFRNESGNYTYSLNTVDDVVDGTHNDHTLGIYHQDIDIQDADLVNGDWTAGVFYRKFQNFVPALYKNTYWWDHLPVSGPPDAATTLAARTNPSRPIVALPMLIQDFVELPQLLKKAGGNLLQQGSSYYLGYQFGWRPLIDDLKNVFGFAQTAAKKTAELKKLYSNGGLKRRLHLGKDVKQSVGTITVDSGSGVLIVCDYTYNTILDVWGTIRWVPDTLPPTTDEELAKIGMRAAFGIDTLERTAPMGSAHDVSASRLSHLYNQAWQLMPWSWLGDWFGNLGDYFAAYDNSIPAHALGLNTMSYRKTRRVFVRNNGLSDPNTTGGGAVITNQTKARSISSPSVAAQLPFLSGSQMSILGALGIQRIPRSKL
jgi:hypothetical protein